MVQGPSPPRAACTRAPNSRSLLCWQVWSLHAFSSLAAPNTTAVKVLLPYGQSFSPQLSKAWRDTSSPQGTCLRTSWRRPLDLKHHSSPSPKNHVTKPPLAQGGNCSQPELPQTERLQGAGVGTGMPRGCYLPDFLRALAEVLEGEFLKRFWVCICVEWPGAAQNCTQARSRRRWAARKGKDRREEKT